MSEAGRIAGIFWKPKPVFQVHPVGDVQGQGVWVIY